MDAIGTALHKLTEGHQEVHVKEGDWRGTSRTFKIHQPLRVDGGRASVLRTMFVKYCELSEAGPKVANLVFAVAPFASVVVCTLLCNHAQQLTQKQNAVKQAGLPELQILLKWEDIALKEEILHDGTYSSALFVSPDCFRRQANQAAEYDDEIY